MSIEIRKMSMGEAIERGITKWPVWEKGVSRFEWTYDETEECYFLEGEVIVETKDGNYTIKAGDFVRFPAGLTCVWDIKSKVKKHYNFP